MKGKHWPRLAVVLIALALVAAACGDSDDTTTTAAAAATTTTEAMAEVPGLVEDGKLIVVTTGNFPPYTLINADTGDNEGYSIDLAQEVADRLGLEAVFPTVDFVAELEGLAQGLYDIADSGIFPSQQRQDDGFVFSRPMTSSGVIAQVLAENEDTAGFGDVTGKKIGGIQGSSQEKLVLDGEAEMGYEEYLGFAGAAEALTGLEQGLAGPTIFPHPLSFTYQTGNEAKRDAIDVALNEMLADGTVAELQIKWFGRCIPVPDDINQEAPYDTMASGC